MKCTINDIATVISESIPNPSKSGYEIFVGLEHYDSGEVKVTRYGSTENLVTAVKVFKRGDILLARRNVYLKRAGLVEFDGVTSGDSIILRVKTDLSALGISSSSVQKYLPFVLNTDEFWNYAEKYSDGTMSKRLSPKTLLQYEFEIPDDVDNKNELLWAAFETKESYRAMIRATDEMVKSQFIEMFRDIIQNKDQFFKLQELIDKKWITYHLDGNHGGDYPRGEEFVDSGVPYISANCIEGHLIDWSKAKYLTEERAHLLKKGLSKNEDVLFAHNATVGPVAILRTKEKLVVLGTSLTAYRCNKDFILPEYLLAYMDSTVFRSQYEAGMQQSTRNQVPITAQRNYLFLIPPIPAQKEYSNMFLQADKSKYLN